MTINDARVSRSKLEDILERVIARVASAPERLADILDGEAEPLIAFTAMRSILGVMVRRMYCLTTSKPPWW